MGATASLLTSDMVERTEPLLLTMQQQKERMEARKRRHFSPTKVFFCHSCSAFSYDSISRSNLASSLLCPHSCCATTNTRQLEEIPRSVEGSLRLRTIMLHLIDARTSDRQRLSFSSKAGVSTVDIVLGVQLVNTRSDITADNSYCCICNEDLKCTACDPYINVSVMRLECGHVFHESCILPWFEAHRSCPSCRSNVKHFTSIPSAAELFESFNEDQLDRKVEFAMRANIFYGLGFLASPNKKLGLAVKEQWGEGTIECSESITARRRELSNKLHELLVISDST
jgi:Ring finger domain